MKKFTSLAPTRISFAGGGSDVTDWFVKERGKCINAAIDLYARVNFNVRDDDKIIISSINTGENFSLNIKELKSLNTKNLLISCLKKFPNLPGLDVKYIVIFLQILGLVVPLVFASHYYKAALTLPKITLKKVSYGH